MDSRHSPLASLAHGERRVSGIHAVMTTTVLTPPDMVDDDSHDTGRRRTEPDAVARTLIDLIHDDPQEMRSRLLRRNAA